MSIDALACIGKCLFGTATTLTNTIRCAAIGMFRSYIFPVSLRHKRNTGFKPIGYIDLLADSFKQRRFGWTNIVLTCPSQAVFKAITAATTPTSLWRAATQTMLTWKPGRASRCCGARVGLMTAVGNRDTCSKQRNAVQLQNQNSNNSSTLKQHNHIQNQEANGLFQRSHNATSRGMIMKPDSVRSFTCESNRSKSHTSASTNGAAVKHVGC